MGEAQKKSTPATRKPRVPVRLSCTFKTSDQQYVAESVDLSGSGIFIKCSRPPMPGVDGVLKFKPDTWESPVELRGKVSRVTLAVEATKQHPEGFAVEFHSLSVRDERKLQQWLSGKRSNSITQSIRDNAKREGNSLQQELRSRSADQIVIFASQARGEEIRILVRMGHPAALGRLFENPRLQIAHVRLMMRDARLKPSLLLDIKRERKYMGDPEIRFLFCKHPAAPECEVLPLLNELSVQQLTQLSVGAAVRPGVRNQAKTILKQKGVNPSARGW